jgi:chromosome segregation ATPase
MKVLIGLSALLMGFHISSQYSSEQIKKLEDLITRTSQIEAQIEEAKELKTPEYSQERIKELEDELTRLNKEMRTSKLPLEQESRFQYTPEAMKDMARFKELTDQITQFESESRHQKAKELEKHRQDLSVLAKHLNQSLDEVEKLFKTLSYTYPALADALIAIVTTPSEFVISVDNQNLLDTQKNLTDELEKKCDLLVNKTKDQKIPDLDTRHCIASYEKALNDYVILAEQFPNATLDLATIDKASKFKSARVHEALGGPSIPWKITD